MIIGTAGQPGVMVCTDTFDVTTGAGNFVLCPGVPTSGWAGGLTGNYWQVCADRVNIGDFFAVYWTSTGSQQVYKATGDPTSTWSSVFSGALPGGFTLGNRMRVRCTPGHAGDIWVAPNGNFSPGNNFIKHSTDGGVTWAAISRANGSSHDMTSTVDMGIGEIASGATYPTLWVYGYGNDGTGAKLGFWRSTDEGVTWVS